MFVDQIFTKYDTDNDGTIDFKVGSQNYVKVQRSKVASVHNVPGPRSLCWPPTLTRTLTQPRRSCGGLSKFTTRIHRVSWKHGNRQQLTTNVQIAGTIDCKELKEIVGNLYESEGYSQVVLSVALVDSLQLSYYHVTDTRPFVASQHVNTVCFCDCIFSSHS